VNNALAELVPIIANAPVHVKTRDAWLDQSFDRMAPPFSG